MTDNKKSIFIFNKKLPPMTEKKDMKDKPAEKKAPIIENSKKEKKKKPKRCQMDGCKMKLSITDFDCRCKKRFCNLHKNAEKHNCTFDYKAFHRKKLESIGGLGGGKFDRVENRV